MTPRPVTVSHSCHSTFDFKWMGQHPKTLMCYLQLAHVGIAITLEQVMGIEPTYSAWKADILTVVRYLLMVTEMGLEPTNSALKWL